MATPEFFMGAGLAAQYLNVGISKVFWTIVVAHVMFTLSFVVVTVKARVATIDPRLEEAGRDLYANASSVFWRITFPLLLPGIMAAAMLSFALSFDDFIITQFNSGPETTFPKFVYTAAARGIPPEANVIGSLVFIVAIAIVMIVQVRASLKAKKLRA
jgi:spermidine/putrescine transport system permease protein